MLQKLNLADQGPVVGQLPDGPGDRPIRPEFIKLLTHEHLALRGADPCGYAIFDGLGCHSGALHSGGGRIGASAWDIGCPIFGRILWRRNSPKGLIQILINHLSLFA